MQRADSAPSFGNAKDISQCRNPSPRSVYQRDQCAGARNRSPAVASTCSRRGACSPPRSNSPKPAYPKERSTPGRARAIPALSMRGVAPALASEESFSRRLAAQRNNSGNLSCRPRSPPHRKANSSSASCTAVPEAGARALRGLETVLCKASRDAADRAAGRAERGETRLPTEKISARMSRTWSRTWRVRRPGELSSTTCSSASASGRSSFAPTPVGSTTISACTSSCASLGGSMSASAPVTPGGSPHRTPQRTPQITPMVTPGVSPTATPLSSPPLSPVPSPAPPSPPASPSQRCARTQGVTTLCFADVDDAREASTSPSSLASPTRSSQQLVAPPPASLQGRRPPSVAVPRQRTSVAESPSATRLDAQSTPCDAAASSTAVVDSSPPKDSHIEGTREEDEHSPRLSSPSKASIDPELALKLHGIPRIPELPRLHEERSLECTFQVTFLVPFGPEGRGFLENIRTAFREAPGALAGGQAATALPNPDKSFVLVPYAGSRTALVLLQEIGPVKAFEHVRLRSQASSRPSQDSNFKAPPPHGCTAQGLPEPTNEMCARSTALVYVVHAATCMDGMERQLGPICSVEAFYAATTNEFLPQRSIAAIQESGNATEVADTSAMRRNCPATDTDEIIRQLQHRRVATLPCTNVIAGDRESHRNLLLHLVNSLAADFCLSARENTDVRERAKAIDFGDTDTVTPVTNLSRTSSPKTTPSSSMLSAAHESPRYHERSERPSITAGFVASNVPHAS